MNISIDVDGVLCDPQIKWREYYNSRFVRACGQVHQQLAIRDSGQWDHFASICEICWDHCLNDKEILLSHPLSEGALDAILSINNFARIHILTARTQVYDTIAWLERVGIYDLVESVQCCVEMKAKYVEGHKIDFHIDDSPAVIAQFRDISTRLIVFDRPYNVDFKNVMRAKNWYDIHNYFLGRHAVEQFERGV